MLDVLDALLNAVEEGRPVVHCQVVETKGSTPQKAGARMLVFEDGRQVGTLGGGCVEAEVKQKAARHFVDPSPRIHSFVLDHDYAWADGLICGGKMTILSESSLAIDPGFIRRLRDLLRDSSEVTEMISVDPERSGLPLGMRKLVGGDGKTLSRSPSDSPDVWPHSIPSPEPFVNRPRPGVRTGVAFLPIPAKVTLIIVGAGHVGQAVAELGAKSGFKIVVADDRAQYANTERFPMAEDRVVGPFVEVWDRLRAVIDERCYVLVVTRGHGHDQEALAALAPTLASYVGLIGSRRKIKMIFEALMEQGIDEACLSRVAAPVGIDIGSESVEEIAVSIVAELIAYRNKGTPPSSLTSRTAWR